MALELGSIVSAVEAVQQAIQIYRRIEGLPMQMTQLGRRMERLNVFLVQLDAFVKVKPGGDAYVSLFSGQKEELGRILASIRGHSKKVYDLFDRYEKGLFSRTHDLKFRFEWANKIYFSLVENSPKKIELIMQDIDYDRGILSDYLALMNVHGVEILIDKTHTLPAPPPTAANKKNLKSPTNPPKPLVPTQASPSPSPTPRRDFKILFVDPYNTSRSVVAEALVKLLSHATAQANGDWRIGEVASAGFFVRNGSDCVDLIDKLDYSFPSFKRPFEAGGQGPNATALAALFDNKSYDFPFKKTIREQTVRRKTVGMQKTCFGMYDYIIVFTNREHDNVIKLKAAVQKSAAVAAAGKGKGKGGLEQEVWRGKGRVLHLGAFISRSGSGVPWEIVGLPKNADGRESRDQWNLKVAEIKTAVKKFLEQEMRWKRPENAVLGGGGGNLKAGKS
ncbi:hypothetical protein B0T19DRAFT_239347 [Cercophora scortea]|uniref:Uncharacterized protein n=1 Tax=Cercophora scortea TaxID=314031 RepID=A0AAE0IHG8_9PEZI|nr:hypothetical protein B0T19DRAFT_239347 [Cercophora scortea]